ncbi:hypothetical protein VOLCADRAFT_91634 [Volvox carteri f. nagariensis]|uniref:Uncharacterized protein n=1 Tax=Volvox carteri f. nagariensis TaxID=3068 RepID=D8TXL1_VOLCA|nr:uncharacterized protein VOLCADRAFT_91634 [Volvox carteri f. nagariensis]EFJ47743.1 hypothetical protein VOLCADRAFT_91634 [Volvox carteri f. nagariensis]|eukprot:XP_002951214.1 hypothetical protein VOLCADRAFT_91634 [Volvox carteri f. nagariensis]
MDYLRKQQLLAEADAIRPGLGAELARFPIATSAELDQIQALLEEHRQVTAGYATLQADYRRQTDEYRRQAAMLEAKIASSGMSSLPPAGLAAARQLAAVASWLGLTTTAETAVVAAWVAQDADKLKQERLQSQREAIASDLRTQATAATRQAAELTAALEAARRGQLGSERGLESMGAEQRTLEQKAAEYIKRIAVTRDKLMQLGYKQDVSGLSHEALEALASEVDSLECSLAEAEAALKMYDSIPPSAAGLASMLERSQKELADVHAAMGSAFVHGSSAATRLSATAGGVGAGGAGGGGGGGGLGPPRVVGGVGGVGV